eukprot:CAMPEP_0179156460 /NCGR_PEP_ID=MMETSP0796-20121207/76275_1 /TAXON_ID=73915 /ORGANISM="Pyrodinium bahamense, Strain pbaha01" /LENGTH=119 /DNA_ID=CAMNT_0020858039 /DNA_START=261 /DNA_END=620 /DNA_ORIENTATION=+
MTLVRLAGLTGWELVPKVHGFGAPSMVPIIAPDLEITVDGLVSRVARREAFLQLLLDLACLVGSLMNGFKLSIFSSGNAILVKVSFHQISLKGVLLVLPVKCAPTENLVYAFIVKIEDV